MRDNSARHTIATTEDIENLQHKWSLSGESLTLRNVTGFYEASLIDRLPASLRELLQNITALRLVYRNEQDIGDLFYSDVFPGLTIELQKTENSNDLGNNLEIYRYLELTTGLDLGTSQERCDSFINIADRQLFYSQAASADVLKRQLEDLMPRVMPNLSEARYIEITIEPASDVYNLRTISAVPEKLLLQPSHGPPKTEVGIVQRQKRHLQDSELKGLSAYLPAEDLEPFMIFFDQRLRPASDTPLISTSLTGTGSHLAFETTFSPETTMSFSPGCRIFSMYQLPKTHFFDIFELGSLFRDQHIQIYGAHDLEDPVWKVTSWGSIMVAEIEDTSSGLIRVPFHSRYAEPNAGGHAVKSTVSAPQVFAACKQDDAAFADNPWESFSIKQLLVGHEYRLRFFQTDSASSLTVETPVAYGNDSQMVFWVTLLSIAIGLLFVLERLSRARELGK